MSILYYDNECRDGLTIEQVEQIRESALKLMDKNMHPRYQLVVNDLFKASNALMNEMTLDAARSFQCSE